MKSFSLCLFCLFLFYSTSAQIENISSKISDPSAIMIYNDEIYVSRYEEGSVMKRSIYETDDVDFEPVISGLNSTYGQAFLGDVLYVANPVGLSIVKIDLADPNAFYSTVVTLNAEQPVDLTIKKDPNSGEDYLYFTVYENGGKLYKVNISNTSSFAELVLSDLGHAAGLAFYGEDLYIAEANRNRITKIDFTVFPLKANPVYTSLLEPLHLLFEGDDLYITEYAGGYISKVDVTDSNAIPEPIVPGLQGPAGLAIHDGYLYFGQYLAKRVSRFNLDGSVAIDHLKEVDAYSLYPNPTSDVLYLKDWHWKGQVEVAEIVAINGQVVKKVSIDESGSMAVADLSPGFYFISFEDGRALKFVKE